MKIKRYKKAFKCLSFYINNFGFHKPFQLLIDGTFCFAALQSRIQIKKDVPKYLGSEIKFLTTQCVVLETEKLGYQVTGAMKIVKTFGIHNCGHGKCTLSGADCILSMVGSRNSNRYIIATQDKDLQAKLQCIPSVPILYINRTSIILKTPSESSVQLANIKKKSALDVSEQEEKVLNFLKLKTFGKIKEEDDIVPYKKAKGPNPLSCKKKRSHSISEESGPAKSSETKIKRKRKRIRLPSHVKQELFCNSAC